MTDYKKVCKWELGRYYEKLMAIDSLQAKIASLEEARKNKLELF